MRELVRTNDMVLVSAVVALLDGAGIPHMVLDQNMSVLEGSLGMLPRRILVAEGYDRSPPADCSRCRARPGAAPRWALSVELLETSEDAVLGGRLRLRQPLSGHRVGHDAILLAAATGGRAGEQAVDLGAGVGAAGLALAARVAGLKVTLVEIDAALKRARRRECAAQSAWPTACVRSHADAEDAAALAAAGLAAGSADRVLMNPPFHDATPAEPVARSAPAPGSCGVARPAAALDRKRGASAQAARRADADLARRCARRGAGRARRREFGDIAVLPVYPRPDAPAIRVLVRAVK